MRITGIGNIPLNDYGVGVQRFPHFVSGPASLPHAHDFIELVYVVSGEVLNEIDGETRRQQPGELAIINYGSKHRLITTGVDLFNGYIDLRRFPLDRFDPDTRARLGSILLPHPGLANRFNRLRIHKMKDTAFILSLLEKMEVFNRSPKASGSSAQLYAMFLVLTEIAGQLEHQQGMARHAATGFEDMERVRAVIEGEYSRELPLEELASVAGCTRHHLCRKFRAYTGTTVGEYILQRRLRQAMFLLSSTREKVLSIALESGFTDITHFNRKFKKFTGMTASTYRSR